jgi:hypothetical protein
MSNEPENSEAASSEEEATKRPASVEAAGDEVWEVWQKAQDHLSEIAEMAKDCGMWKQKAGERLAAAEGLLKDAETKKTEVEARLEEVKIQQAETTTLLEEMKGASQQAADKMLPPKLTSYFWPK